MTIDQSALRRLIREIFAAAGSNNHEAQRIAFYLVEANRVGHDAQGVIQVPRTSRQGVFLSRCRRSSLVPSGFMGRNSGPSLSSPMPARSR